jgi:hypothetical protein
MSTNFQSTETSDRMPAPGTRVTSADGETVGTVRNVHGGYFELEARMGQDFWLSRAYVGTADEREVCLNISRQEVDAHRLSAPGLETSDDADRAAVEDRVISDEEALSQRERMERELAEQRARLARERGESV